MCFYSLDQRLRTTGRTSGRLAEEAQRHFTFHTKLPGLVIHSLAYPKLRKRYLVYHRHYHPNSAIMLLRAHSK